MVDRAASESAASVANTGIDPHTYSVVAVFVDGGVGSIS